MRNIFIPLFTLIFFSAVAQQDGTLDGTWTNGGRVTNNIPGPAGSVNATELQKLIILPTGKFLQTFTRTNGTDNDFGLARLNADGSLDLTFGGSNTGYIITNLGGDDFATSMALQSDGKIIVTGTSILAGNGRFALARFNTDGTLDGTFGSSGIRTIALGNDDLASAVAIRSDNKIIVGGSSYNGFVYRFTLAQFTANGNLDNGNFNGGNGFAADNLGNSLSMVNSIVIKTDGSIIAAGFSSDLTNYNFAVAQYTPAGVLDAANFGSGLGYVLTDFGSNRDDQAYAVATTTSGKIIAAGYTDNGIGAATDNDFALAQYTSAGVLDAANFGSGGKVTTNFGLNEIGYSLAMQPDTRIILFGSKNSGLGMTDNNFVIARYLSNGALDPTFGGNSDGTNTIDFGSDDRGYSVALGPNYIMTSGISSLGNDLALARLVNTDVALPVTISSFTATKQNNSVQLNWQTLSEQDAFAFDVERSNDGIHFTAIGRVQASGNSQSARNYSLNDGQPFPAVNFYRLKLINANGSFHYSGIVVVRFQSKAVLQAFPNPVHAVLYLQVSAPAGVTDIHITDISGRVVRRIQLKSTGNAISTSIDMSMMQKGIYFISVNREKIKIFKD